MAILILGVVLWAAAHLFKRLMPEARARLGNAGKGLMALLLVLSIVLMVIGYRSAEIIDLWVMQPWMVHVNNILVFLAIFMMSPAPKRGRVLSGMRHPMLAGFKAWAVAHLLVNGDVASVILFGGLLAWAVAEVILINRSEPGWTRPATRGSYAKGGMFLVASIILMVIIGYVHYWLGPWPYPV